MKTSSWNLLVIFSAVFTLANFSRGAEDEKDFKQLFDGKDLRDWHFSGKTGKYYRGWEAENGVLQNKVRKGESVMDLLTDGAYWNFILRLEYQIPHKSNSGVFLRDKHEIQLLGDYETHELNAICNGAIWNFATPKEFVSKPSTEWQQLEVTMIGHEITVILNGKKIHDKVKCTVNTRDKSTKGMEEAGPIRLQGTLGSVSFRNIRIKELPK
jgi:hypothetical protein